ncbi:MAG: hypothetical protein OEN22_09680 [Gammaproteobacteria bacterium]|nr:hypothetical protein [Gammaproteobacteria bacterium]
MNSGQESTYLPDDFNGGPSHIVNIGWAGENPEKRSESDHPQPHGIIRFITELRRRRVCRAVTMYAVAMWLVCQIVEIVGPELGLPEWTLKLVIMLGLLGFPIALILSWLIDITPNGLVMESADGPGHAATEETGPRRPLDQVIDCSLVLAALIIGVQLAVGVLSTETNAAPTFAQKIAVVPFRVASGNHAETLAHGLVIELQHELASRTHMTVVAARDPYLTAGCLSLTGAVAVGENQVRITVTMIDNDTGTVIWSQAFERPRSDSLMTPVEFAHEIVAALPVQFRNSIASQVHHAI